MEFECVRCGACCRNYPMVQDEVDRLYGLANQEQTFLLDSQLKKIGGGHLLVGWCPFLDKGDYDRGILATCTIWKDRPQACKDYPLEGLQSYPECRDYFSGIIPDSLRSQNG